MARVSMLTEVVWPWICGAKPCQGWEDHPELPRPRAEHFCARRAKHVGQRVTTEIVLGSMARTTFASRAVHILKEARSTPSLTNANRAATDGSCRRGRPWGGGTPQPGMDGCEWHP